MQQQLRADYEEATALCLKVGMRDCKELREATIVRWRDKGVPSIIVFGGRGAARWLEPSICSWAPLARQFQTQT